MSRRDDRLSDADTRSDEPVYVDKTVSFNTEFKVGDGLATNGFSIPQAVWDKLTGGHGRSITAIEVDLAGQSDFPAGVDVQMSLGPGSVHTASGDLVHAVVGPRGTFSMQNVYDLEDHMNESGLAAAALVVNARSSVSAAAGRVSRWRLCWRKRPE